MNGKYGEDISIDVKILSPVNRKFTQNFYCANPALDEYFSKKAADDNKAVTYLFIDADENDVIACITLACSAIFIKETEDKFSTLLSAMEVLYFGVNEKYKHIPYKKGSPLSLSHMIFSYMQYRMKEMSHNVIGASKIVLYSVPEAVRFYQRCDFKEFGDDMLGEKGYFTNGCVPMYYDMNSD